MYDVLCWIENKTKCFLMTIKRVESVESLLEGMPAIKKVVSVERHVNQITPEMVTSGGMFGAD